MFIVTLKRKSILTAVAFILIFVLAGGILIISLANNETEKQLPILMYHSILKDKNKTGTYVVTPDSLEEDMKALKDNGFETILPRDAISFVLNNTPLPEKPIILSFDDGCYNNLTYLYPLLEKYDMKAAIAVVGEYTDRYTQNPDPNPNYAYLTWNDISFLSNSNKVEILNHTYNLHSNSVRKGASKKRNESEEQYCEVFKNDVSKMQRELLKNCSIDATTFVYPFGSISDCSLELVKELGFKASFSCRQKINILSHDPNCLYQLGRFNRSGKYDTKTIMQKIKI